MRQFHEIFVTNNFLFENENFVKYELKQLALKKIFSPNIVTGGLTVAYDVYKLHSEIDKLVTQSVEKSAAELRDIADKLEQSLQELKVDEGKIETALEPLKN